MNKRSRHIAPFLFLGCLLLPLLAVVFLQVAQGYLKFSADNRMKEEKLVTISIPETALHWEKENKELLIEGRFFDVTFFTLQNGSATVTGFFDTNEDFIAELLSYFPYIKQNKLLAHFFLVLQCFSFILPFLMLKEAMPFRMGHVVFASFYLPFPFLSVLEQPPKQ